MPLVIMIIVLMMRDGLFLKQVFASRCVNIGLCRSAVEILTRDRNLYVMLCCRHDERLAVKIVRNIEKYHYAAKVEVDILSDLQKAESPAKQ